MINSDVGTTTMVITEPSSSTTISTSSSTGSTNNPNYGPTNVSTQIGTNAYLPCKVRIPFGGLSLIVCIFKTKLFIKTYGTYITIGLHEHTFSYVCTDYSIFVYHMPVHEGALIQNKLPFLFIFLLLSNKILNSFNESFHCLIIPTVTLHNT